LSGGVVGVVLDTVAFLAGGELSGMSRARGFGVVGAWMVHLRLRTSSCLLGATGRVGHACRSSSLVYVNVAVLVALRRSAQVWVRSYVDLFLYVYVLLDQYSYPRPCPGH